MLDFLLRIANLCRKELLAILKDPASRVILVVPALMQSLIFGYAATYDLSNVPYALLDQSHGGAGRNEKLVHGRSLQRPPTARLNHCRGRRFP